MTRPEDIQHVASYASTPSGYSFRRFAPPSQSQQNYQPSYENQLQSFRNAGICVILYLPSKIQLGADDFNSDMSFLQMQTLENSRNHIFTNSQAQQRAFQVQPIQISSNQPGRSQQQHAAQLPNRQESQQLVHKVAKANGQPPFGTYRRLVPLTAAIISRMLRFLPDGSAAFVHTEEALLYVETFSTLPC